MKYYQLIDFRPSKKRYFWFATSFFLFITFAFRCNDGSSGSQIFAAGAACIWLLGQACFSHKVIWDMPKLKNETAYLFKLNDNYIVSGSREEAELWADLKEEEGEIEKIGVANFFEK